MRVLKRHKAPLPEVPARMQGWATRLADYLAMTRDLPHKWGRNDCLTRVADVCQAMTGVDPMRDLREEYTSEADAGKIIIARGGADVGDMLAQAFKEIPPMQARRGDAGVVMGADYKLVAVVVEGSTATGTAGTRVPRTRLIRAFRVGD